MVRYTKEQINKIKTDRLLGLTIQELMDKYKMPKTTIWHHIHSLKLSKERQRAISARRGGSAARCKKRWISANNKAEELLKDFSLDSQWVSLLTALYWSEGTKKRGFIFTNTDSEMIRVYVKILREYLNIPNRHLQILVRITNLQNKESCLKHWSNIIGVEPEQIKLDLNERNNSSKVTYGICRITVANGSDYLKLIHSLIQGITVRSLS